jgi:DNA polymerase-3 subunit delta
MKTFYGKFKKHGPEPAYYFHGSEDVLKDEAIADILEAVLDKSLRDFNFDQVQAGQVDPAGLADLCSTLPMMADRRVVVVRGVEAWKRKTRAKKAAVAYLQDPAQETVLVLVQSSTEEKPDKALTEAAYTVDFSQMRPAETARWLKREAGRHGIQFDRGADDHLLATVGANLGALRSEVAKLSGLAVDGPITIAQVGEIVGIHQGETLTDWRDAVLGGDTASAASLIESILNQSGTTGVRMVMALSPALIGLGVARAHYDAGKRGRSLQSAVFDSIKVARPFGLKWGDEAAKWASWAPEWPLPRVRQAIDDARRADELLKDTHLSDDAGLLTDLVMRLAAGREVTT